MSAASEAPTSEPKATGAEAAKTGDSGATAATAPSLREQLNYCALEPDPKTKPSTEVPLRKSRDGSATSSTRHPSVEVDTSKPKDFDEEVNTNDTLPTPDQIRKIEEYMVLDKDGKTHTFKSLYNGKNVARRVLIVFIRHFFCGNCQEYLRSLCDSISPDSLLQLPVSTFIVVIGCGDPGLIDMYTEATGCKFPIYTDPTRRLFDVLGMVKTLQLGVRPAYMRKSMATSMFESILQGLRQIPKGMATRGGDQRQVGGEFLFEPLDLVTPVSTPQNELDRVMGSKAAVLNSVEEKDPYSKEEKRVTWCHRMRSTRDHAEIPELMEILGLDGQGQPIKDTKRWERALESRKGTGLTLAPQMNQLQAEMRSS